MPSSINLEKLADEWEPRLRDAFLRAIADHNNRVNIAELTRLIEQGRIQDALRLVGLEPANFSSFSLVQAQMFSETGIATAAALPAIPQAAGYALNILFNVRNPRAEQWLRDSSGTLIKEITDDQRVGIRSYLESGLQRGDNPRTTALDLVGRIDPRTRKRTGGIIGLHSQQIGWLQNYTAALENDPAKALTYQLRDKRFDATVLRAVKDGTPIPADLRQKMQLAYANRALRYRAENIARTETMQSLVAAQTEAYQQAIDDGKLDASLITRFPVTAGDERVRPTHRLVPGMNKDGVKWNEPFKTPMGPKMHAPYEGEVNCRCHERIRVDFLAKAVREFKASG